MCSAPYDVVTYDSSSSSISTHAPVRLPYIPFCCCSWYCSREQDSLIYQLFRYHFRVVSSFRSGSWLPRPGRSSSSHVVILQADASRERHSILARTGASRLHDSEHYEWQLADVPAEGGWKRLLSSFISCTYTSRCYHAAASSCLPVVVHAWSPPLRFLLF